MFKDLYSGIRKNKHKRMKYLVSCICIIAFALSIIALPLSPQTLIPNSYADPEQPQDTNQQMPYIGDPNELYPDSNIYSLDLSEWYNNPDSGSHSAQFPSKQNDNGKAYPYENAEPILSEHIDVIDESKPLKIWVKLENDQWYSSENLNDLSLVDPSNIVYYAIETPYGFVGYYVNENDVDFGHCPIIYSPILDNGTFFKEPVGGMYLKLWVKAGGQWYQRYINDRSLGYDYRQYMQWEIIDSETWQLGFNIPNMELSVGAATREFDVYVGIQVSQNDKFAKIKQEVIPHNDYEDIGLEWMCLTAPHFVGTDYELTTIIAENETWSKEISLDKFVDITTEIPDYVQKAYLVSKNGVKYHTFDFSDLASYGLDGTELFRVEDMLMPNGANQYVCRIGATKGEGILASESLVIDPEISISDSGAYIQITTPTYSLRVADTGGFPYYYVINGRTYQTAVTTAQVVGLRLGGVQGEVSINAQTFTPTILETNSDVRVVLQEYWNTANFGATGQQVNITYTYFFYRDYFFTRMDIKSNSTWDQSKTYSNYHIFLSTWAFDDYITGNSTVDSNGFLTSTYLSLWVDLPPAFDNVIIFYDNTTLTETITFSMINATWISDCNWKARYYNTKVDLRDEKNYIGISATDNGFWTYFIFFGNEGGTTDTAQVKEIPFLFDDYITDADANHGCTMTTGSLTNWNQSDSAYHIVPSANTVKLTLDGSPQQYQPVFILDGYTDASNFYLRYNDTNTDWVNGTDYFVNLDGSRAIIQLLKTINGTTVLEFQNTSFDDDTYTLDVHIVVENADDSSKEEYWYGWVKLATEHWNVTAYTQLDANGEAQFTNLENGSYYLEIYPPGGSGVFGTRIGCTNITIAGNTTLGYPVYDYRGHIALNWNYAAATGTSNMTQYILDRMDGVGAQKGDIIQIWVGYDYPLESINANWGKDNFKDVIIGLKQAGYRIWIGPRLIYVEDYDFWKTLDDFSDVGYSDGDYFNEGTNNDNYKAHNAWQQFEANIVTIKNTTHTGDTAHTFTVSGDNSISICLRQQDYWDVYDVNDSAYLNYGTGAEEWSFDNATVTLTIHDATQNHVYEVYYLYGYGRIASPISNYNNDPYFIRTKLMELLQYYYENCTLPNGECAIDGLHPNYFGARAVGSWDTWRQGWCGLTTKVMIDWFLGNYTQYASDFKLSWVTYQGTASEFARGRNDSLPFMHDWLYFREHLLNEEWFKPVINQAKAYNVSIIMYDGDDNRLFSSEEVIRLGVDMLEHQWGTGMSYDVDDTYENYVNYWATRIPFAWDIEETWQSEYDHEGLRTQLQRASALGALPAVMYNHLSPFSYNIPTDYYDEFTEAHNDFKEVWNTYKQHDEWRIAKIYFMVGVVGRQTSFFYGGADPSWLTPKLYQLKFSWELPTQYDYISTYFIEENGVPDDCDLLIIGGQHSADPYTTYHALYSDVLNSTLTTYVENGGSVWFMGDVGRYATNGSNLATGFFEKLANIACINASMSSAADIFYVNETHWIINDELGHGIIDGCEGYSPDDPDIIGEPEWRGLSASYCAIGMFNISSSADSDDVVIWYGNSTTKMPYLYIRDDVGTGYVAYSPTEYFVHFPMGGRLYETLLRSFYYLTDNTDSVRHVNVTLENYYPASSYTKEKMLWYALYNNSYSWLISLMYDPVKVNLDLQDKGNSFTTYVNLSDFMDTGHDYLIYCYDRPNSSYTGDWNYIWDSQPFSETNKTLLMDESGDHLFQKNERFRMAFERDIAHWFVIVEAMSANVSLIQAKATNDTILVTNQGYVGSTYVINATAHTDTLAEFVVYCNRTISSVTINGSPVSYSHNLTSMILTFNHTFASDADIEINGGVDTTDPSITSPSDVSYQEGDVGNSISWTITESYPNEYNITRTGALIQSGSYSSGVAITISVDGLSVGIYTYVIGANDTTGNSASDSVTVTVTAVPPSGDGNGGNGGDGGGGGAGDGGDDDGVTVVEEIDLLTITLLDPIEPEIGVICILYNEETSTQTFILYVTFINDYTQRTTHKDARMVILSEAYGQRLFSFRASQGDYSLEVRTYTIVNGTEVFYAEQTFEIVVRPGTIFEVFTDFIRYALAVLIIDLKRIVMCMW